MASSDAQSDAPSAPVIEAAALLESEMLALADELDRAAMDRQTWAEHPGIGGNKPRLASHLRGKRYGYSHAAQLIRSRVAKAVQPARTDKLSFEEIAAISRTCGDA